MTTMTKQAGQTFEVGDEATYCGWSDRKAGRIIAATATKVTWQADKATLLNGVESGAEDALKFAPGGFSGHTSGKQRWQLEADENGITRTFTKRANGRWILTGAKANAQGACLVAGASHYYDYNF